MLATALTLVAAALPGPPQDGPYAEGPHVQVRCHFHSERVGDDLAAEVRDVAERVWSGARVLHGVSAEPLERPFELHLYATRKGERGYEAAVNGLQPGAARGTVRWSHWGARSVHVRVRPVATDRMLELAGLPPEPLRNSARGVAVLARLEATGGEDRAPGWFAAGAAGWLADRALVEQGRAAPGDRGVWLSTALATVRRLQAAGDLPALEELLADRLEPTSPGRSALQAAFFAFLTGRLGGVEGWGELGPALTRGTDFDPGSDPGAGLGALATALGWDERAAELPRLEREFHAWLRARAPLWEEQDPALAHHPEGWVQAPVIQNAICWRAAPPPAPAYEIRGEFELHRAKDGSGQVNLLVGRLGGDFLQVSANLQGGVVVWDYRAASGQFERIQSREWVVPMPVGEWVPFELLVADEELRVRIGGLPLLPVSVRGRDMTGQWGLGTFKGSTTLWRGLAIGPVAGVLRARFPVGAAHPAGESVAVGDRNLRLRPLESFAFGGLRATRVDGDWPAVECTLTGAAAARFEGRRAANRPKNRPENRPENRAENGDGILVLHLLGELRIFPLLEADAPGAVVLVAPEGWSAERLESALRGDLDR